MVPCHCKVRNACQRRARVRKSQIMANLKIKSKNGCMWDLVSMGEVMLRLDPGDERISTTRHFSRLGGRGRIQRCSRPEALLRDGHGDGDVRSRIIRLGVCWKI